MSKRRKRAGRVAYQLKVTLRHVEPPIWRRLLVSGDTDLGSLHLIIQAAMGWENCHLHEFEIKGKRYGATAPEGPVNPFLERDVQNEDVVAVSEVAPREKTQFLYTYDSGDTWEHDILVERILPAQEATACPVCLEGKRACPPEDCGGVWGYADLIEALADPNHPEREDLLEWVGEDFDPEKLDVDAVNHMLRRMASR